MPIRELTFRGVILIFPLLTERSGVPISYVTVDDRNVPPYSARIRWKPVYIPHYTSPASTLYQVEMREQPQPDWRPLGSDVRGTEYMVSDLSPRKTYMFRVRAKSPSGELSNPSMPAPFYPLYCELTLMMSLRMDQRNDNHVMFDSVQGFDCFLMPYHHPFFVCVFQLAYSVKNKQTNKQLTFHSLFKRAF